MIDPSGGRDELRKLLADQDKAVQDMALAVAEQTARLVNQGVPASLAVSQAMAEAGVAATLQQQMGSAVVQSLCVGAGIWPQITASAVDLGSLASTAMHSTWDGSGLTLSQRLYGTTQDFKAELVQSIQAHVQAKETAWNTARQIYDGYGFGGQIHQDQLPELPKDLTRLLQQARSVVTPEDFAQLQADAAKLKAYADRLATAPLRSAYKQFAERVEKGLTKGLDRLVQTAAEEKARYHASRILRTETARAWGQGFFEQARRTPQCIGIRWSTSSAHRIFDVCDFCAGVDLYGMGPGIYPKDRCPAYPAHPHCFCGLTMVFKGQVPDPSPRMGPGGKDWIKALTEGKRSKLLTRRGEQSFRGGASWEGVLRNWGGIDNHALSNGAKEVLKDASKASEAILPKTVKEAESWAMKNNLADRVSYKGLSIDAANGINKALKEHLEMFPDLRKGLQFVGSAQERNRLAKAARKSEGWSDFKIRRSIKPNKPGNIASSADSSHIQYEGFLGIAFNEKALGTEFALRTEGYDKISGVGKWFVPGRDMVTDVTAHELGHQLDALYALRTDPEVLTLWKEAAQAPGGWNQSISQYAGKWGIKEGIAEGWSEAFGSASPRDFARRLKEVILKKRGAQP